MIVTVGLGVMASPVEAQQLVPTGKARTYRLEYQTAGKLDIGGALRAVGGPGAQATTLESELTGQLQVVGLSAKRMALRLQQARFVVRRDRALVPQNLAAEASDWFFLTRRAGSDTPAWFAFSPTTSPETRDVLRTLMSRLARRSSGAMVAQSRNTATVQGKAIGENRWSLRLTRERGTAPARDRRPLGTRLSQLKRQGVVLSTAEPDPGHQWREDFHALAHWKGDAASALERAGEDPAARGALGALARRRTGMLVDAVIQRGLREADLAVAVPALMAAGHRAAERGMRQLIDAAPDKQRQAALIGALGLMGEAPETVALLSRYRRVSATESGGLRSTAILALGNTADRLGRAPDAARRQRGRRIVDQLLQEAGAAGEASEREALFLALGNAAHPRALPLLRRHLRSTVGSERATACWALRGFPSCRQLIQRCFQADADPEVRQAADQALKAMKDRPRR